MSSKIAQKEHKYISASNVDKKSELFKDSFINWEEIFLRLPSIETYVEKTSGNRLTGGADHKVNEILDNDEEPLIVKKPDEQIDGNEKLKKTIERVFENLKDATGALENIEKNHEQELKLMLEEVTAKIKTWKGDVQLKIDAAETELSKIKIQLLNQVSEVKAKDRELLNLKNKIKQVEESKIAYEKSTNTANTSKTLGSQTITSQVFQRVSQQPQQQVQSFASFKRTNPSLICSLQSTENQNKQTLGVPTTLGVNAIQLSMQIDQERNKKQAELEAECQRLKAENERILKEHAEYESEIQQALLRGVSCLNVEALKILGKSPFSCCVSCSPCNIATNIEATKVMKDNWTPQGNKLKTNDLYQLKEKPKIKKKAATICCGSSGNCNKSSNQNSTIFLLPQKRQSTLNNNPIGYPRFCARSNVVKNKNYCSGKLLSHYHNNCKNICSIVRENSRAIADIFGASSNQKYCESSNKTKRYYDD